MRKGDKVICIRANGMPMLIKDKIYTVLAFSPRNAPENPDGIKLYETNPGPKYDGFNINRFRKIDWIDELEERLFKEVESELLVDAL